MHSRKRQQVPATGGCGWRYLTLLLAEQRLAIHYLSSEGIQLEPIDFLAVHFIAVQAKDKNDEEKYTAGSIQFMEEDPSFALVRNVETHQSLGVIRETSR